MSEAHEERITQLETHVSDIRVKMEGIDKDVKANTEVIAAIKADTAEIVQLMKGGKVFGKLLSWFIGISVACTAVYHLFKDGR